MVPVTSTWLSGVPVHPWSGESLSGSEHRFNVYVIQSKPDTETRQYGISNALRVVCDNILPLQNTYNFVFSNHVN